MADKRSSAQNTGLRLNGRIAVVTGGMGGIGMAFVDRALAEGAVPVLWDMTRAGVGRDGAGLIHCDVTDPASVEDALAETLEKYGRIDILVNAAGVTGPVLPVADYPLDAWDQVFKVNMTGSFLCTKAVLEPMKAQRYGRIVNISSIAGKEGNQNQSAYSASKAAVMAFTKSLGKELADDGILVNCITPAILNTKLADGLGEAQLAALTAKIPLGRIGQPEEAAAMIAWLASEECSFTTGGVFDLSGGRATY